jgi:hypothetical protein
LPQTAPQYGLPNAPAREKTGKSTKISGFWDLKKHQQVVLELVVCLELVQVTVGEELIQQQQQSQQ